MRKIDRLFEIVQMLRGQRLRTATEIAENLGVSTRTIYRDIQGLMASGVPIEGERGVGYVIRLPMELPPLKFTSIELQAIRLGVDLVAATADNEIAQAAKEAAVKIAEVLPENTPGRSHRDLYVYFKLNDDLRQRVSICRQALDIKHKIKISYQNEAEKQTDRVIRPLALEYWGSKWILTAWCEMRAGFRMFRLDRMADCVVLDTAFKSESGKTYTDYLKQLEF